MGTATNVKVFIASTVSALPWDQLDRVVQDLSQTFPGKTVTIRLGNPYQMPSDATDAAVEKCLHLVAECDYFIAILTNRYGWRPPKVPENQPQFVDLSLTEIEINYALGKISPYKRWFYITDWENGTDQESPEDATALADLKKRLKDGGEKVIHCTDLESLLSSITQEFHAVFAQEQLAAPNIPVNTPSEPAKPLPEASSTEPDDELPVTTQDDMIIEIPSEASIPIPSEPLPCAKPVVKPKLVEETEDEKPVMVQDAVKKLFGDEKVAVPIAKIMAKDSVEESSISLKESQQWSKSRLLPSKIWKTVGICVLLLSLTVGGMAAAWLLKKSDLFSGQVVSRFETVTALESATAQELLVPKDSFVAKGTPILIYKFISPEAKTQIGLLQKKLEEIKAKELVVQRQALMDKYNACRTELEKLKKKNAPKAKLREVYQMGKTAKLGAEALQEKIKESKRLEEELTNWQSSKHEIIKKVFAPLGGIVEAWYVAEAEDFSTNQKLCGLRETGIILKLPRSFSSWCQSGNKVLIHTQRERSPRTAIGTWEGWVMRGNEIEDGYVAVIGISSKLASVPPKQVFCKLVPKNGEKGKP